MPAKKLAGLPCHVNGCAGIEELDLPPGTYKDYSPFTGGATWSCMLTGGRRIKFPWAL